VVAVSSIESGNSKRLNVLGFMNKRNELEAYTIEGSVGYPLKAGQCGVGHVS